MFLLKGWPLDQNVGGPLGHILLISPPNIHKESMI